MPLTLEGCAARRKALVDSVDANLIIITNPLHILYFTGMYISQLALSGWGSNFLLIDPYEDNKTTLLVHNWLEGAAKDAHVDEVVVWMWYDSTFSPMLPRHVRAIEELNLRLPVGAQRVAAENGWLPWHAGVTDVIDISRTIRRMRRQKYPDEVVMIRECVQAVRAGHIAGRDAIRPGVTELDVYNAVHAAIVKAAGHAVHLMGDFASGERAITVGGPATPRTLQAGEVMILDIFPIVNGYRADYTATVSVDGTLTDWQARLEKALHAGLESAENILKPGTKASDVYEAVCDGLASVDPVFMTNFTHHTGHGLGLGHPEAPFFVPHSEETLLVGDVVTLEPGSYSSEHGFGGRIEHNYLITETGFERLSQHSTSFT